MYRQVWGVSFFVIVGVTALVGCQPEREELRDKAPRPVTSFQLVKTVPERSNQLTGSIQSWKTEEIAFEVNGRLEWALEPGKDVLPRLVDENGNVLSEGDQIAQVDPTPFKLALETANENLKVAEQELKAAEIRSTTSIDKQIKAAQANVALATQDYDRIAELNRNNAVAQSELDSAINRKTTFEAELENLQATKLEAQRNALAAQARFESARVSKKNAQRDLDNTKLYSSFAGQVDSVSAVPGSIVGPGSPVVRIQMMNPIKVELEVSAQQSRELQRKRQVELSFLSPDGTSGFRRALLHNIDPSADSATRTFTASFLILNRKRRPNPPANSESLPLARTSQLWPMNISELVNGKKGTFMIEQEAIETDGNESWVWLVRDVQFGDPLPRILKVEKKRVVPREFKTPFLGNWTFQEVQFADTNVTDQNLLVGRLEFSTAGDDEPQLIPRASWDGVSVFLDSGDQWMLRPGDLATINIDAEVIDPGFFVPIDAIYEDLGDTFVFAVADGKARKIKVDVTLPKSLDGDSVLRIESDELAEGMELIHRGVHFLTDGESVQVVETHQGVGGQK